MEVSQDGHKTGSQHSPGDTGRRTEKGAEGQLGEGLCRGGSFSYTVPGMKPDTSLSPPPTEGILREGTPGTKLGSKGQSQPWALWTGHRTCLGQAFVC